MTRWMLFLIIILVAAGSPMAMGAESGVPPSAAQDDSVDTIYLDEDVIAGNQELPRVLYILPWREIDGKPVPVPAPDLSLESWLRPINPDDHRRSIELQERLRQSAVDN